MSEACSERLGRMRHDRDAADAAGPQVPTGPAPRRRRIGWLRLSPVAVLLLSQPIRSHAASDPGPASEGPQLWTSLAVASPRWHSLTAELEQQFRFADLSGALDSVIPEASVAWRPAKWLRVASGARVTFEREDEAFQRAYRFHGDLQLSVRWAKWIFSVRQRAQQELGPEKDKVTLRQRLAGSWKLHKRVRPSVSAELFTGLIKQAGDISPRAKKVRYVIGVEAPVDGGELCVDYRLERSLRDEPGPDRHIIGVGWVFSLE